MLALIIALSVVAFLLLGTAVASLVIFFQIFRRKDDKIFDEIDLHGTHYEPHINEINRAIARMRKEPFDRVGITGKDGKKLYGYYFNRGFHKTAVMVHGYRSNPYNNFSVIAGDLLDRGYNVLFIFQHSHGESEGTYITMGRKEQYDVLRWIDFVALDENVEDILVYGTSMGGATVAYLSDKIKNPKVKALTIDCAFTSFYKQIGCYLNTPARKILYAGMPVFLAIVGLFLGIDITKSNTKNIARCTLPVCFIHGESDDCVPLSHTVKNYEACKTEKKLITVPEAGHTSSLLVGGERVRQEYFEFIGQFIK